MYLSKQSINRNKKLAFQIALVALYLFIKFDIIKFDLNCGNCFTKIQCCFVPNVFKVLLPFRKTSHCMLSHVEFLLFFIVLKHF